jgi:RNA polymerase sigma factor (sigma-70 family)
MTDSACAYTDLLQRLAEGDEAARDELIERAQDRLRLRVSQMLSRFPLLRRCEGTSDVLQDVLFNLSGVLKRIHPHDGRHFLGLAGQQIRWKLLDLARRSPEPGVRTLDPSQDLLQTTHDPNRLAQWAEIHNYIQHLPEADRELFDLIFYQGTPQPLVAEILRISSRTLKRRWQKVRLAFMARFGSEPF